MRNASLVSPSCRVDRAIGGDQPLLARAALDRIAVLHADHAREILRAQPADDVAIIDLAASRLLAAGIVAELDIADLVPAGAERIDQIPGLDLLVIKVGEYLDRRAVDGARDRIALRHGRHEHARMVPERVERLHPPDTSVG